MDYSTNVWKPLAMGMNTWWTDDPEQKYWVEITDREDLGANLWSPQVGFSGQPTAGYESMRYVQPGDIVLHWWKQSGQKPAFVGWSTVLSSARESRLTWKAHGKTAKGRVAKSASAWEISLEDFQDFESPVTLTDLQNKTDKFEKLLNDLQSRFGKPIYFPFSFGPKTPMKTMQYYLTKLPKEFLDIEPRLKIKISSESSELVVAPLPNPKSAKTVRKSGGSGGYQQDPEKRMATDSRGMKVAENWLMSKGYDVEVLGKPYDLRATTQEEEIRVEVKSSIGILTTVELTKNEVDVALEAGSAYRSLLIAVENIHLNQKGEKWFGSGGEIRIWWDWEPEPERLIPIRFKYVLPPIKTRHQTY